MSIKSFVKVFCNPSEQSGFILVTAIAFLFILTTVGLALSQGAVQGFNLSVRHSYTQIAHIASKAAIDFAEEQYELDPNYAGTAEQDLIVNEKYRVTIEVEILFNQGSTAKRVQAYGRVYIPETSPNADYVRDIKSTIIRNGEVIGEVDPSDFNPILWLDANEPSALYKTPVTNSQYIDGLWGNTDKDIVEQGGSDASSGNRGKLYFGNDDIELTYDGNSRGHQWIGLRYRGISTPKNAVVSQAYIQFVTDETKQAGAVQLRVQAVAADNPGIWNGDYAVSGSTKTSASVTWTPPNWNVVGASGANERVDVTPIVQELVNRSGWNPGQAMAFTISEINGSGIRTAEMGNGVEEAPKLFVQWQQASAESTVDGDEIDRWNDRSLNNNDAIFAYGVRPQLKTSQINGLNAVRFSSDGTLRSALSSNLTGGSLTAYMVMMPRVSAQSNARFLSMLNTSSATDEGTSNAVVPFYQSGATTSIRQRYNSTTGLLTSGSGSWNIFSGRISSSTTETMIRNGSPDNTSESISGVNYTVNEIFIGGTRTSSSGTKYADVDIAELVVVNSAMSCSQIQQLEYYFSNKYSISIGTRC